MRCFVLAVTVAIVSSCTPAAEPRPGSVLVRVDTDAPVPSLAGRLRVDAYSESGVWLESRDYQRTTLGDWPATFGVVAARLDVEKVILRVRIYPDGAIRDYRGERQPEERTWTPPFVPTSMDQACDRATPLAIGSTAIARVARLPFAPNFSCMRTVIGSAAFTVNIDKRDTYRFGLLRTDPADNPYGKPTRQVTMQLRKRCDTPASEIACVSAIVDMSTGEYEPARLEATLDPGTYSLVTGGAHYHAPMEIEVGAARAVEFAKLVPATRSEALPRDPTIQPLVGNDPLKTPTTEPAPGVAIERLVTIELRPNVRGVVDLTLRGACAGIPAVVPESGPNSTDVRSCIDDPTSLAPMTTFLAVAGDETVAAPRIPKTFGAAQPCGSIENPEIMCVPGGVFVLGGFEAAAAGSGLSSLPMRVATVSTFHLDKHEVTVARYREALAQGMDAKNLPLTGPPNECFWNKRPGSREGYGLACIDWYGARAYCQFRGGDLPSEAQWEYAAAAAGRIYKTKFPWGDDAPECSCEGKPSPCHAPVFGRGSGVCGGVGPLPVDAREGENGDVTPLGIVGMGGGLSEWTLDAARPYAHPCWEAAPMVGRTCAEDEAIRRINRGGLWYGGPGSTLAADRGDAPASIFPLAVGVRCAYARKPAGSP